MDILGKRLKILRKKMELTQAKLSASLSYGYTAISNYEAGRNEPSLSDLVKIADFFDVSTDYLLGRDVAKSKLSFSELEELNYINASYTKLRKEQKEMLFVLVKTCMKYDKDNDSNSIPPDNN